MSGDLFGYTPPPYGFRRHSQHPRQRSRGKGNALYAAWRTLPKSAAIHLQRQRREDPCIHACTDSRPQGSQCQTVKPHRAGRGHQVTA